MPKFVTTTQRFAASVKKFLGAARRQRTNSLAGQMVQFACVVWFSFLVIITIHALSNYQAARQFSELEARNGARLFQEHADRSLDAADALLSAAVQRVEDALRAGNASQPDFHAALVTPLETLPQISRLIILNADGIVVGSSRDPTPPRANLSSADFFIAQRAGAGRLITPPTPTWDDSVWRFGISRRVVGPQGEFAGVILALIEPAYFTRFYRTWDLSSFGAVALLTPQGQVIAAANAAAPDATYTGMTLPACALGPAQTALVGPLPTTTCLLDGQKRLVAQRATAYGLTILVGAAQKDTWAIWRPDLLMAILLVAGITALLAGISILRLRELRQHEALAAQVQTNEERFHELYDQAPVGYHELDTQGRITRVNQTELSMLGFAEEEMLGRPIWDFLVEREDARRSFADRLANQTSSPFRERAFIRKDGSQIWAILESRRVLDAAGNPAGLRVTVQDVTEYRRTQAELRRQESEKALILSSIAEEVVFYDLEQRVVWTNRPRGPDGADLRPAGAHGPYCFELFRDRQGPCNNCPVRRALQTGEAQEEEIKIAGDRWVLSRSRPVRDEHNTTIGAVEIVLDITARKRAEEAQRASESKLRAIFNSLADGVIVTDLDFNIIEINPALLRLAGISDRETIIGRNALSFVSEQYLPLARQTIETTLREGQGVLDSIVIQRKAHAPFEAEIATARLDDAADQSVGFVAIIRDVTQRRRMEADLRNAQRLESVGVLAGGIAHDFNNILTAILGNISLARIGAQTNKEIADNLLAAERACLRARGLTQQLLTFSRGGAPVRHSASIIEIVRDTALFTLRGSQTRCEFQVADDLWPAAVDQGQISQVIQNLIINADQAMPAGGVITLVAENYIAGEPTAPTLRIGQRYVHISVRDQGVGIPKEIGSRIFDPYFTTKESGRGLGLATSYSIIQQHDGHIAFESQEGVGATFDIFLPATETRARPTAGEREPASTKQGRVLIMDDEEAVRETALGLLNSMGFQARAARDGREMLTLYGKMKDAGMPFDLVIMDLTIPGGMGGAEAIQELLKLDPHARALVSSGYANAPVMADYTRHGFVGVVAKPYRVEELERALTAALERRG